VACRCVVGKFRSLVRNEDTEDTEDARDEEEEEVEEVEEEEEKGDEPRRARTRTRTKTRVQRNEARRWALDGSAVRGARWALLLTRPQDALVACRVVKFFDLRFSTHHRGSLVASPTQMHGARNVEVVEGRPAGWMTRARGVCKGAGERGTIWALC
jgi:hypothetical protein